MVIKKIVNWLGKQGFDLYDLKKRLTPKKWEKGTIVYYVGPRKEPLGPNSLKEGASGSYTAVIKLTQQWAKQGYRVVVYSELSEDEGIYEGVEYKKQYNFNPYDTFDILIIFQHPYILKLPVKARKVCLEWQDVLGPEKVYPREKLERFDIIFAKSQYQRKLMPFIEDNKFIIVTNGVDKDIIELSNNKKEPYKLIYASRYYRGLEFMLAYGWPVIKREIPEAELHIYYGWLWWQNNSTDPEVVAWKDKMIQLMAQEGVIDHGKIGQDKLIVEKSTSSIHYYGCTYEEIDCVSVRESALVGCVPVTTDYAVMTEKNYCVKIPGEPKAQATQEAIAYKIVELLKNPEELASIRQQFIESVKHETWDAISQVWLKNFELD